ncbi:MAG: hypothetical protein EXR53_00825 [Dehalococcoidia bacterium]|nr:hypothetical protein [Dehalococcoidia bacterium]
MRSLRIAIFCLAAFALVSLGKATPTVDAQEPEPVTITVNEAVGVSDALGVFPPVAINVNETVGVADILQSLAPPPTATPTATPVLHATLTPTATPGLPPTPAPTPMPGASWPALAAMAGLLAAVFLWRLRRQYKVG